MEVWIYFSFLEFWPIAYSGDSFNFNNPKAPPRYCGFPYDPEPEIRLPQVGKEPA
jgi:hypothetical protein